ncbi:MAG: hypothetical protein AAGA77_09800 [Bacteroidota bacterium]
MSQPVVYYPRVSDLINASSIPGDLVTIEQVLDNSIDAILKDLRYKNLLIEHSSNGNVKFYSLVLTKKKIVFPLIGDKIQLVFFPGESGTQFSDLPLTLEWEWNVSKYIQDFQVQGFSHAPKAFLQLLLELADVSENEFMDGVIANFISSNTPYVDLVDSVLSNLNQISVIDNQHVSQIQGILQSLKSTLQNNSTVVVIDELEEILNSFEEISDSIGIDFDPFVVLFETIVNDLSNVGQSFENLIQLFKIWLGNITMDDLEQIIIPQFKISFQDIAASIEFSREWLVPLVDDTSSANYGTPITDETIKTQLKVDVGSFMYDTRIGFQFLGEPNFSFDYSQIGKTGLTLKIDKLKLDLSTKTNISEATADGRPLDFMGVYAQEAIIGLPEKWFKEDSGTTLGIFGRNLLIGNGGITGKIDLETLAAPGTPSNGTDEMIFTLGKKPSSSSNPRKGFKIGFSHFTMEWQQNALIESSVKGSLTIPNFKQYDFSTGTVDPADLKIDIEALFEQDGDFSITAKADGGVNLCIDKVLIITLDSLEVGKDDDKVFLCVSGALSFENNDILKSLITQPIEVKKLCIYNDGSFEIEGGSITLPASVKMKFGPTEVFVTNLTFGSEEIERGQVLRKFKQIGFNCGLSAGNAGLDLRGDGITYCFTVDDDQHGGVSHRFLKISGIGIDLVIPGSASKETAALLIQGYLSIKQNEYKGSVAFQLPKAKIAGGAAMILNPKKKAWVIDAHLELGVPIELGCGLGIYAGRILMGRNYIAAREAIGLTSDDKWFDYYKKDVPPGGKGVHTGKMYNPVDNEAIVKNASSRHSIGAGLSLATTADDGKTFSLQAFFLLSLPELIFIQGKANILGERVDLTDDEPPFFAFVAFSPGHSVEFGLGADYKLRDSGKLVKIHAEVEAGFFMENRSAWHVNFGTKNKPITARILDLFNAYSYLTLSASGIEAGFGVDFGFDKKYGPVKAKVGVYLHASAQLGFAKKNDNLGPQLGAAILLGGYVDVSIWGIGLGISIATTLEATVPRPFRIAGSVEVCVSVKLIVKKFEKCIDVEFVWEKNTDLEDDPIHPLPADLTINPAKGSPVSALHIGSGRTYEIDYLGASNSMPSDASGINKSVPMDAIIDLRLEQPVAASDVSHKIGGITNGPRGNVDLIPPKPSFNRVTHRYKIKDVAIWAWNANSNNWVDYHPYEALTIGSVDANMNVSDFKLGFFQKTGKEYNKIRFLAQTPFSYVKTSSGDYIPEQMGITSGTLFCKETLRKWHCVQWKEKTAYQDKKWYHHRGLNFVVRGANGSVVPFNNPFSIPNSLLILNGSRLEIFLPENAVNIHLKLFTFSSGVTVKFLEADHQNGFVQYNEVLSVQKSALDLVQPVVYENEAQPIRKIIIEPPMPDTQQIQFLMIENDQFQQLIYEGGNDKITVEELKARIARNQAEIAAINGRVCQNDPNGAHSMSNVEEVLSNCNAELLECRANIESIQGQMNEHCIVCERLKTELKECLEKISAFINLPTISRCLEHIYKLVKINKQIELNISLSELIREIKKCENNVHKELTALLETLTNQLEACEEKCQKYKNDLEAEKRRCEALEKKIKQLQAFIQSPGGFTISDEGHRCGTYIHEVCWLTEEDHYYNQTIPGQDAIEKDFQLAQSAIEHTIAPIWKPEQKYLIRARVADSVNGGSDDESDIYFGFETKGPIGHFPENHEALDPLRVDTPNPNFDQKIEAPETVLKHYINNQKSYPDPTGNILNRKQLYYKNPKILLFYTKPYVYHFFGDWPAYNGLPAQSGELEVVIKDPVEDVSDPLATDHTSSVFTLFPETVVSWKDENDPIIAADVQLYGVMRNPELKNPDFTGGPCWQSGGSPIVPASKSTEIIPKHLKPLKLYRVIFNNKFEGVSKEVLSFGFQTSRFGSLAEHIDCYHLKDKEGNTRDAIFTVDINLNRASNSTSQININRALNIVQNDPSNLDSYNEALAGTYADPYQRLMEGHFKFKANHPSLGLEFNFIREEYEDEIIALWINSIEPLNDPKIPFDVLRSSIKVLENGNVNYSYYPLFSKDRSQVVLMNANKKIDATDLRIRFGYLEWNGQLYQEASTATTDNLIQ